MKRCFISVDIPENIRQEIQKIQNQLPEFNGKKTEQENLHLTLKFLGEISEDKLNEVKNKLKNIKFKKFETEINSLGVFSENFIRIVWLHLTNCEKLQKDIDEVLKDLFPKEKRFMSHLTIARVKNIRDKNNFLGELKRIEIPKIRFEVGKFKLKKSVLYPEGSGYKTIEEYRLIWKYKLESFFGFI